MAESSKLVFALNLKNNGLSQYTGFNFNSFCKFGDYYLGASDSGIFKLEQSSGTEDSTLSAYFELPPDDFGSINQKELRKGYMGGEANGNLTVTVKNDEGSTTSKTVAFESSSSLQSGTRFSIGYSAGKGRYWSVKVAGAAGTSFAIDTISLLPVIKGLKPSGI